MIAILLFIATALANTVSLTNNNYDDWFLNPHIINITHNDYNQLILGHSSQDWLILFAKRFDAFVDMGYRVYE